MKIVIAPDSFKGSLSALAVGKAIQSGILKVDAGIETVLVPMADGGEGTVQSLTDASGGKIIQTKVHDPLFRRIKSFYEKGFDGIFSIIDKPMSLQEAIDNAAGLLENAAENVIRLWINMKI